MNTAVTLSVLQTRVHVFTLSVTLPRQFSLGRLLLDFLDSGGSWLVQAFRISFCLLKGSPLDVVFVGAFGPILDLGRNFDVGFELGGCPPRMLLGCFVHLGRVGLAA